MYPNSPQLPFIGVSKTQEWISKPYHTRNDIMLWSTNTRIPPTNTVIDMFIEKSGGENNFVRLLGKGKELWIEGMRHQDRVQKIRIIGSEYRCDKPEVILQTDYISKPISSMITDSYRACMFEDKKEIHANTVNNKTFRLVSDTQQNITFQVFPIDPYNHKFGEDNASYSIPLGMIDPLLEYHNLQIFIGQQGVPRNDNITITKKYTLFRYTHTNLEAHIQSVIYPYYEVTATLPAGESVMEMMYYSYTPTDGNAFFIVE